MHACFNLCCGAKTSDNSRFKNGTEVAKGQPVVGVSLFLEKFLSHLDISVGLTTCPLYLYIFSVYLPFSVCLTGEMFRSRATS